MMNSLGRFATLSVLSFTLGTQSGCLFEGDEGEEGNDPFYTATPQDRSVFASLFEPAPYGDPVCDQEGSELAGERELRLFTNGPFQMERFTKGLARYYRRHGLQFFTRFEATELELPYVLETDQKRLEAAARKKFPKVDFDAETFMGTDEELLEIYGYTIGLMTAPLVDFAKRHGKQPASVTNIVLVDKIGSTDELEEENEDIAGLALSPALIDAFRAGDPESPEAQLWTQLALPPGFNAMMFLDAQLLERIGDKVPVVIDLTVAHEFGHTGGLTHHEDTSNLMTAETTPTNARCESRLAPDQLATLSANLNVGPSNGQSQALTVEEGPFEAPLARETSSGAKLDLRQNRWKSLRAQLTSPSGHPEKLIHALLHAPRPHPHD